MSEYTKVIVCPFLSSVYDIFPYIKATSQNRSYRHVLSLFGVLKKYILYLFENFQSEPYWHNIDLQDDWLISGFA